MFTNPPPPKPPPAVRPPHREPRRVDDRCGRGYPRDQESRCEPVVAVRSRNLRIVSEQEENAEADQADGKGREREIKPIEGHVPRDDVRIPEEREDRREAEEGERDGPHELVALPPLEELTGEKAREGDRDRGRDEREG